MSNSLKGRVVRKKDTDKSLNVGNIVSAKHNNQVFLPLDHL